MQQFHCLQKDFFQQILGHWSLLPRSYKVQRFSGPDLQLNHTGITVNCGGVHIVDSDGNVLVKCSFEEITDISSGRYTFEYTEIRKNNFAVGQRSVQRQQKQNRKCR